jgi:hypothetical protein
VNVIAAVIPPNINTKNFAASSISGLPMKPSIGFGMKLPKKQTKKVMIIE